MAFVGEALLDISDFASAIIGTADSLFPLDIVLNATVIDVSTGNRFTGYRVNMTFFNFTSDGFSSSFLSVNTTLDGEAIVNITYPNDQKAHAYMAMIVPAYQNGKLDGVFGLSDKRISEADNRESYSKMLK